MSGVMSLRAPVVADCYDFFDRVFPQCGFLDYTEGMYLGRAETSYEEAQANQINWLLNQARCAAGSRIVDIGCGNGTLLNAASRRGAQAVGITISKPQVRRFRRSGLDARLIDYRDIPREWDGAFDAIVANGSLEHFAQPADVRDGRHDQVYRELFAICHRLLKPTSSSRRFVTTAIPGHDESPPIDPLDGNSKLDAFPAGSPQFHYQLMQRTFGGYYPSMGQLERCAGHFFKLIETVDGTEDYRRTSEAWFDRVRRSLRTWTTGVRIWPRLALYALKRPRHCLEMYRCLLTSESWQYQLRGVVPPTRLLRHVWEYQKHETENA